MIQPTIPAQYFVSVGHIGTVWRGSNKAEANMAYYNHWQKHYASGSTVTLTVKRGDEVTTLINIEPSHLD